MMPDIMYTIRTDEPVPTSSLVTLFYGPIPAWSGLVAFPV